MAGVAIPNLEFHVTHVCNLRCENCSHYSNLGLSGHVSLAATERYFTAWSPRIVPRLFSLLGGEPTLHPELTEHVELAAHHWPESTLQLVTNGWFLDRHPRLPSALARYHVHLEISIHHDGPEYRAQVIQTRGLIERWQADHELIVNWRPSFRSWRRIYHGAGADMRPYTDGNPQASWSQCPARWCPQILGGQIYKCPPLAYLRMLDERIGLSPEWTPYLDYRPLNPGCSDDELREFLTRRVEEVCGMCPANPPRLHLESPIPAVSHHPSLPVMKT